jgi:hypothetical protein
MIRGERQVLSRIVCARLSAIKGHQHPTSLARIMGMCAQRLPFFIASLAKIAWLFVPVAFVLLAWLQ